MNIQQQRNKEKYEDLIFESNHYGFAKVINYVNKACVEVEFSNTGYKTITNLSQIKSGEVKDLLQASIAGVGVLGKDFKNKDAKTKTYQTWSKMIQRCYGDVKNIRNRTYEDCYVSENFLNFSEFKKWCINQIGVDSFDEKGKNFQLDKDILVKGNKVYSEDTCCFVPQEINTVLLTSKRIRGDNPIGVFYHNRDKKYVAKCKISNKTVHLGYYLTSTEAFIAYKKFKESYIKEVANKWKDQIDVRVYEALMKYEVSIDD